MKKHVSAALIILAASSLLSQSLYADNPSKVRQRYEEFRQKTQERYESFRSKVNARYAEMMEKAWERYYGEKPIPKPDFDEPVEPPVDNTPQDTPIPDRPIPHDDVVVIDKPIAPQPQPVEPIVVPVSPSPRPSTSFDYFGKALSIPRPFVSTIGSVNEKNVARAWRTISESEDNTAALATLLDMRKDMDLCDWAYLQLIDRASASIPDIGKNERTLLLAWLFCSSGYSIRLGNDGNSLVMLYGTDHVIYEKSYFCVGNLKFYPYNNSSTRMNIFAEAFPGERNMTLIINQLPILEGSVTSARERVSRAYPDVKVKGCIDNSLMSFFDSYPSSHFNNDFMTRWAMLAWTPFSPKIKSTVVDEMKRQVSDVTQEEGVARILNWLQTGFEYKLDDEVWGHDRAFFAEETIYYPYCDCEDRAILFVKLIKEIYGIPVALVYYPGHLAAAVNFTDTVNGDYIETSGRRFTICDPTYINAPIGRTMPGMDNGQAKLIIIN